MNTEQQLAAVAPPPPITREVAAPLPSSRVLNGSVVMLLGSVLVSVINFSYNVVVARKLGPADFGNVSAVATLLMMSSALTQSFQLLCAKFVARNESYWAKSRIYRGLMKRAWTVSVLAAVGLVLVQKPIAALLKLPSSQLIVFLAVAVAFLAPMGVKRGGLQGQCQFAPLATTFVLESAIKLMAALVLIYAGYGVFGAVGAIAISVLLAFAFSPVPLSADQGGKAQHCVPASFPEGMQTIVFFVGQVVINNVDILLVKHFFDPQRAGLYAAVALVGRLLYFASWQVVSAMFPVSAASKPDERHWRVLITPLLLVSGMAVLFVVLLVAAPRLIIGVVFGEHFAQAEALFGLYAAGTGIYSLAVVLMTYEMSRKIANTGWLQLVISGLMALLISIFHDSLKQVIVIQICMMVVLLASAVVPFLRSFKWRPRPLEAA
jgi:O-antigen/teichoic acid export membrane protein